jgi:hypothetical protein
MVTGRPRSTRLVTPCCGDTAWHNAGKMLKLRIDVQAYSVERDPLAHPDADCRDLVFRACGLFRPAHPHADTVLAPFCLDVEPVERGDQPVFQAGDEGTHVLAAPGQVEHDVGHALAGAVIGVLAATPGLEHAKPVRCNQVGRVGGRAGGIQGRVLDQPDQFRRLARGNGGGARLHEGDRISIVDEAVSHLPLHRPGAVEAGLTGRNAVSGRGHG